jgi:transposase InsO family protein
MPGKLNKSRLATKLGISRASLYYVSKRKKNDEKDRKLILEVMESNPSYGHKRIALALGMNRKKILRLMKIFDLKPKLMRRKGWAKPGDLKLPEAIYRNEIKHICPVVPDLAWAADFTYIKFQNGFIYLATIIDIYTKEVIGSALSRWHNRYLVKSALLDAIKKRGLLPLYFHTDQGSEYQSEEHADYLKKLGVTVSMSRKSSPWENGYQESFYSQFKLELGPVNRFATDGHLAEAVYRQIYYYNHIRIHTSLKMPPSRFYQLARKRSF